MPSANSSADSNTRSQTPPEPSGSGAATKRANEVAAEKRRSREGCLVCRSRKKRCDMVRPCCGACSRLHFECKFPAQVLDPITGQLVTVKQPNKRKKKALGEGEEAGAAGDLSVDLPSEKKKLKKAQTQPSSQSKRAASSVLKKVDLKGKGRAVKLEDTDDGAVGKGRGAARSRGGQQQSHQVDEENVDSSSDDSDTDGDFLPYQVPPPHLAHLPIPINPALYPARLSPNPSTLKPSSLPLPTSSDSFTPPILLASEQHSLSSTPQGFRKSLLPPALSPNLHHSTSPSEPAPSPSPHHQHPQQYHPTPTNSTNPLPTSFFNGFSPNTSFKGMLDLLAGSGISQEQIQLFQQHQLVQQFHHQSPNQPQQDPMSAPSPSFSAWMEEFGENGASLLGQGAIPFSPSNWVIPSPPPGAVATPPPSTSTHGGDAFTSSSSQSQPSSLHRSFPSASSSSRNPHDTTHHFNNSSVSAQHSHTFQDSCLPPNDSPLPFDPTYPHLIPILSPNQPAHLPHQLPSPFLATHQSLPWSPIVSASHPFLDNNSNGATIIDSDSFFASIPSPFLGASLQPVPDDGDAEVEGFVTGRTRPGSSSSGSGSSSGGSKVGAARSPRREQREHQTTDGRELSRRRTGRRETLTIAPSVTFNLPDLPEFILRQAPLLFDYFVAKLAPLVSVLAPDPSALSSLRNYRGNVNFPGGVEPAGTDIVTVFLPMAFESDLVLVSILAWSAMHLSDSGEPWAEIADVATSDASSRVQQSLRDREFSRTRLGDGPVTSEEEELLAGLALLSEIEICRGSTQNWYTPLKLAQNIIRGLGGPKRLQSLGNTNSMWIMRNIAYHELLSSSTSLDGPALEPEEYGAILSGGINSFMGCCQPVFQIIAEISRLSVEASRCGTHADRDARIESLRILAAKESRIKARLDTCYPNFTFSQETSSASSYHFVTFRAWVLTARLYLRQVVSHCNAHSLVSQLLMSQLLESISLVVGTPAESSLLFPIFVAGVDSTMERDRQTVKGFFDTIDANCRIGNIQTAFALLEEVWQRNEAGEKWVNWAAISREKGWNVSFA